VLHTDKKFEIVRTDRGVELTIWGDWSAGAARLSRRLGVTSVSLTISPPRLDFLLELNRVDSVSAVFHRSVDLSVLQKLPHLKHLGLLWRSRTPPELDLRSFKDLTTCSISYRPELKSVFECHTLRVLRLSESNELTELDLTGLPELIQLDLWELRKLRRLQLSDSCRLLALEVTTCPKLEIDWRRVGKDLQYLWLGGRPRFPLESLTAARKLRYLMLNQLGKLPTLRFLIKLQKLKAVDLFPPFKSTPTGVAKIIKQINEAGGRGAVLMSERCPLITLTDEYGFPAAR
jgi:hypothetical protein